MNFILFYIYQHFTKEHYFNILKSKLQKIESLIYNKLKLNMRKVIRIFTIIY